MDAVHSAHPFHLVCHFQGFCNPFLYFHGVQHHFHVLLAKLVDFYQMIPKLSFQYEAGVTGRMVLFQKPLVQLTIFSNLVLFLLLKFNVQDAIIAFSKVYTAHFFKDRFHSDLLCVFHFQPLFRYFDCFPIAAVPFTTNEPQSYVFSVAETTLYILALDCELSSGKFSTEVCRGSPSTPEFHFANG